VIGYECRFSFEKLRESWMLCDCRVELDRLPLIGRFVEVEGPGADAVQRAVIVLGLGDERLIRKGYVALLRRQIRKKGIVATHLALPSRTIERAVG
jgi:adenylate cyclase class IV